MADFLGIKSQNVSAAKRKNKIPPKWLKEIAKTFKKNIEWLETGIGPENITPAVPEPHNATWDALEQQELYNKVRRLMPDEPEPEGDGLSVAEYIEVISKITRGVMRAKEARSEIKEVVNILGNQIERITTEREQDLMDRKLLQRLVNRVDQLESELKDIKDKNDRLHHELERIKGEPPPPQKDGTNF